MRIPSIRSTPCLIALMVAAMNPLPASAAPTAPPARETLRDDAFLKQWLVLGPLPAPGKAPGPDAPPPSEALDTDLLAAVGGEESARPEPGQKVEIGGKTYAWKPVAAKTDAIDLEAEMGERDHAVAYAWAEFEAPEAREAVLGIGSDDAVKAWLNGKPVHRNRIFRALRPDDDLAPVTLRKGANRLLLKIYNATGEYGFAARPLGPDRLAREIAGAAGRGDLDTVDLLLAHGADPNGRDPLGLTALQAARVGGYEAVVEHLAAKGADADRPMPSLESYVDALLAGATRGDTPGAAILVARDGKILLEKGYGYADIGNRVPVTPRTRFRIASVTKQFTASAILKLKEEGKLDPGDSLSRYFPEFPRGDEVTLRHLLNHTSGIHSYTNRPDFESRMTLPIRAEELIREIQGYPYDFDPGEKWAYNNSGYFLLGAIVEKVSGKPYDAYLRDTFFRPLEMESTGAYRNGEILPHEATGYAFLDGAYRKARNWDMSWAGGQGVLYSTVEDLYRWNEALFGGRALGEEELKAAFTPVSTTGKPEPNPTPGEGYGYGWVVSRMRGVPVIGHEGGLDGFASDLERFPDQNVTVVTLVNCSPPPPELAPGEISRKIARFVLWKEMKPVPGLRAAGPLKP